MHSKDKKLTIKNLKKIFIQKITGSRYIDKNGRTSKIKQFFTLANSLFGVVFFKKIMARFQF